MEANQLRDQVAGRTGINAADVQCPRNKAGDKPCILRVGDSAMTTETNDETKIETKVCVTCNVHVNELILNENIVPNPLYP